MEYLTKRKAFEAEQAKTAAKPAEGIAQPAVQAAPTEADKAAAAQLGQQPGEAAKPAEGAAQPAAAEGETVTPKGLADLMQKTPELGAFLEQHPEVKGPLFATARRLAAIEPIAALFPTVGDAQFAQRQASDMVGLKTASLRAVEAPETIPELLSAFDGQFAVVDKDGKPVLDAQGNPTFESDHRVFQDALIGRRLSQQNAALAPQIEQLKGKLASGVYPHAAAKAMDQKRLETLEFAATALEVVENVLTGDWFQEEAPAIPANAPEEFKVWAEQERQRLADERKKLDEQQQGKTTEERKQAKTQFETAVRREQGSVGGRVIGEELQRIVQAGEYIPEMELQRKWVNPQTGMETDTSDLVARLYTRWQNALMKPGSRERLEIAQHELLPMNEQTKQIRTDYYRRKAAEMLPGMVREEITRIQNLVRQDQDKRSKSQAARAGAAETEPSSAGSPARVTLSDEQLKTQAEEAAKKMPGWESASPTDRQARLMTQYHKLRGGIGRR